MRQQTRYALLATAAAMLQGCGGGGSGSGMAVGGGPQPAAVDGFTQNVSSAAAAQSEVGAPVTLDSYVAVEADQAMPVAVY
jgi:hypothetical protein